MESSIKDSLSLRERVRVRGSRLQISERQTILHQTDVLQDAFDLLLVLLQAPIANMTRST
jgi:hypothetical protein